MEPQKPVLAWEREARLHGARVAYVTRAARSFNRFTCSPKSPDIPQRTARRSISHAVDRSASSLAALARSLRSLDEKERERERERERENNSSSRLMFLDSAFRGTQEQKE